MKSVLLRLSSQTFGTLSSHKKNTRKSQTGGSLNCLNVKVVKNKESLRNGHCLEETPETGWPKLALNRIFREKLKFCKSVWTLATGITVWQTASCPNARSISEPSSWLSCTVKTVIKANCIFKKSLPWCDHYILYNYTRHALSPLNM